MSCKRCGRRVPTSPAGNCEQCIERSIAEDPRYRKAVDLGAALLDHTSEGGDGLRATAAVLVLLGFLERCRK